MIGQNLSHFRITAKLGEGGMGEVYLAEDTKLGREVALKVLPEELATDANRLARFELEARLLASLDHPNIAAIYEVGVADVPPPRPSTEALATDPGDAGREEPAHPRPGTAVPATDPASAGRPRTVHYLVMQLAEGETLAERIARGPIPLEESLTIALQITRGLEAAHERGVVHRDLKPGNVMVDARGSVKILDFGLAKAMAVETDATKPPGLTHSPTLTYQATLAGRLLGTAAYMSPEQAKGLPADRRSDLWAFGVVLWEMVTGRRLHEAATVSETLAEVLKSEPPWEDLPPDLPRPLVRLLRRCLERDPDRRQRDAGDARLELLAAQEPETETADRPVPDRGARVGPAVLGLLAALALLLGLAAGRWSAPATSNDSSPESGPRVAGMRQLTDLPGRQGSPALSPDGSQLLYVDTEGGDEDIFLLRVGGEKPVNLTAESPVDDFDPSFSPDGSSIVFVSERQGGGIFVMGATGESPRRVVDHGFDPRFSPDGQSILYTGERVTDPYSRNNYVPLHVVGVDGTGDRELVAQDAVGGTWSPTGARVAYWSHEAPVQGQRDIWTVSSAGGDDRPVTADAATDWDPFWSADGRWLYFLSDRGGSPDLWRVRIDERTGETLGTPQPMTVGIARVEEATIAVTGSRIALTAARRPGGIVRLGFDPETERVTSPPVTLYESSFQTQQAHLSRDGRWIATRTAAPEEAIFVLPSEGGTRRILVRDEYRNRGPVWSADGQWIVFYSNRSGKYDLWAVRFDGSELRQITKLDTDISGPFLTLDGQRVCAQTYGSSSQQLLLACFDLGTEGIAGLETPQTTADQILLPGSTRLSPYRLSPDGSLLGADVSGSRNTPAVYSFEDQASRVPRDDAGEPIGRSLPDLQTGWIDSSRMLFWDTRRQSAMVWDLETDALRPVPDIPGPGSLFLTSDGRTLFVERQPIESDVWLLTLEGD